MNVGIATSVRIRLHYLVRNHAWTPWGLGFLFGVLPDVDHLFEAMARTTHVPFTILLGCILVGSLAYDRGLHPKSILNALKRHSFTLTEGKVIILALLSTYLLMLILATMRPMPWGGI